MLDGSGTGCALWTPAFRHNPACINYCGLARDIEEIAAGAKSQAPELWVRERGVVGKADDGAAIEKYLHLSERWRWVIDDRIAGERPDSGIGASQCRVT